MEDTPLEFELHGYVDGVLDDEAMARVEKYLLENPDAAAKVKEYLREKRHLRDFASEDLVLQPSSAIHSLETRLAKRLKRPRFLRWPQAAVLAIAFVGSGWFGHTAYSDFVNGPRYTDEIVVAHALTSADPSEVGSIAHDRLSKLFSRIGEPVRLPDLSRFGLAAVGAQLLPSGEGPVLHILYRNRDGEALSYFLYHDTRPDEVPLNILHPSGVTMAYWQHDYSRHAVTAPMSDIEIKDIALFLDSVLTTAPPEKGA
jgi:anti-sigma factor RsiW